MLIEETEYRLVRLANGAHSVHVASYGETFHPVVGPVEEAKALYVEQGKLRERVAAKQGSEFVVWDIGLGAAANALTVIRALEDLPCAVTMVSFEKTLGPLEFAIRERDRLEYPKGFEKRLADLMKDGIATFQWGAAAIDWQLHLADFAKLIHSPGAEMFPKPDLILFDAFSPAKNPEMWEAAIFRRIFQLLDPDRPCLLPTYSRSTMLRVTLLLAGFFAGTGHATGEKEETTIASNKLELLERPLGPDWLKRARNSTSAEPLWEPRYRQARLSEESWVKLTAHPQFGGAPC